jgi:hypothetical protein
MYHEGAVALTKLETMYHENGIRFFGRFFVGRVRR